MANFLDYKGLSSYDEHIKNFIKKEYPLVEDISKIKIGTLYESAKVYCIENKTFYKIALDSDGNIQTNDGCYVMIEDTASDSFHVTEMPSVDETEPNTTVQYIGEDTDTFKKGHIYKLDYGTYRYAYTDDADQGTLILVSTNGIDAWKLTGDDRTAYEERIANGNYAEAWDYAQRTYRYGENLAEIAGDGSYDHTLDIEAGDQTLRIILDGSTIIVKGTRRKDLDTPATKEFNDSIKWVDIYGSSETPVIEEDNFHVTEMPVEAEAGTTVQYIGNNTEEYKKGHIYTYKKPNSITYKCYLAEDNIILWSADGNEIYTNDAPLTSPTKPVDSLENSLTFREVLLSTSAPAAAIDGLYAEFKQHFDETNGEGPITVTVEAPIDLIHASQYDIVEGADSEAKWVDAYGESSPTKDNFHVSKLPENPNEGDTYQLIEDDGDYKKGHIYQYGAGEQEKVYKCYADGDMPLYFYKNVPYACINQETYMLVPPSQESDLVPFSAIVGVPITVASIDDETVVLAANGETQTLTRNKNLDFIVGGSSSKNYYCYIADIFDGDGDPTGQKAYYYFEADGEPYSYIPEGEVTPIKASSPDVLVKASETNPDMAAVIKQLYLDSNGSDTLVIEGTTLTKSIEDSFLSSSSGWFDIYSGEKPIQDKKEYVELVSEFPEDAEIKGIVMSKKDGHTYIYANELDHYDAYIGLIYVESNNHTYDFGVYKKGDDLFAMHAFGTNVDTPAMIEDSDFWTGSHRAISPRALSNVNHLYTYDKDTDTVISNEFNASLSRNKDYDFDVTLIPTYYCYIDETVYGQNEQDATFQQSKALLVNLETKTATMISNLGRVLANAFNYGAERPIANNAIATYSEDDYSIETTPNGTKITINGVSYVHYTNNIYDSLDDRNFTIDNKMWKDAYSSTSDAKVEDSPIDFTTQAWKDLIGESPYEDGNVTKY